MSIQFFKDTLFSLITIFTFLGINVLPATASEKLTVLLDWFVNPDHAPLIIAEEKGFFMKAG